MQRLIDSYSNKEISFRFQGKEISFFLSQALFSSYGIDRGSRFLLESIPSALDMDSFKSVLDIGSGVGTLGLSLKKAFPQLHLVMQDRDALAAAFGRINAEANGLTDVLCMGGLAFQGLGGAHFDLIVSNIPAKVGRPVLNTLYREILERLNPGGSAAIVVVQRIAEQTMQMLQELGAEITLDRDFSTHRVFHFREPDEGGQLKKVAKADSALDMDRETGSSAAGQQAGEAHGPVEAEAIPPAYYRDQIQCQVASHTYLLDTVWGASDFDTPPFTAQIAAKLLSSFRERGLGDVIRRCLVWNPGQGHIPMIAAAAQSDQENMGQDEGFLRIDCAGRDMLELLNTLHNLTIRAPFKIHTDAFHVADPLELRPSMNEEEAYQLMVVELEHLSGVPSAESVFRAAAGLLDSGGILIILGKSAHMHPFGAKQKEFRQTAQKKHRGYKGTAFTRR